MGFFRTKINQKIYLDGLMLLYRRESYDVVLSFLKVIYIGKTRLDVTCNVLRIMSLKHIGNRKFAEQSYAIVEENELLTVFPEDTKKYLDTYLRSNLFSEQVDLLKLGISLSKVPKNIKKTFPLKIENDNVVPPIQIDLNQLRSYHLNNKNEKILKHINFLSKKIGEEEVFKNIFRIVALKKSNNSAWNIEYDNLIHEKMLDVFSKEDKAYLVAYLRKNLLNFVSKRKVNTENVSTYIKTTFPIDN